MTEKLVMLRRPLALGLAGGILGGMAMALWMMLRANSAGQGFWTPVSMCMASFAYPHWANQMMNDMMQMKMHGQAMTPGFEGVHGFVGLVLHMAISMVLGVGFALALAFTRLGAYLGLAGTVAAGVLFGVAVWAVMEYGLLPAVNSLMADNIKDMVGSWVFLVAHLVFGLLLGAVVGWQYRDQPLPRRILQSA